MEGGVTAVSTSRGNTFINFGGVYPNQTFTGWIPAGTPLASYTSLQLLKGKKIEITGRIELYRGKPEIRVLSKSQIAEQGKTFLIQSVSRDFEAVIPGLNAQRIELSFTAGAQNGAFPAFHRDV